MERQPEAAKMLGPRSLATCAVLMKKSGAWTMPMNKVTRYVHQGPEHNIQYYFKVFTEG